MTCQFAPQFQDDGSVLFRVHAPACEHLELVLEGGHPKTFPMKPGANGLFTRHTQVSAGTLYRYRVPDGNLRPDPASQFQPEGVHGPSQLVDHAAYQWSDDDWQGIAKEALILYELHIGTFTEEGTYAAAIDRLDELVELGITAIELMPVAQSAGRWNWGYDGTNFFAPRNTFGTPDQLRQLVEAAHERGLAVLLDVVYNHFGAEGNYLHPFGGYVSQQHTTIWGDAPNLDDPDSRMMRDYIVANAVHWIENYHFDGLRLDATHCIMDRSPRHIVREIGQAFAQMQKTHGRQLHLIAESNVYDPELLTPLADGGAGFDAIWCDDFLHATAAVIRPGEPMSDRHYEPYADLDVALRRGYVFHGTFHSKRRRVPLEEVSQPADLASLVVSIQNHDFIGNHPQGRRLHQVSSPGAHRAAAALMLMYPAVPMLFMGEEFACDNPFFFFVDFGDHPLREAVEQGRRREYPQHDWNDVESPLAESAFRRSKIGPREKGHADTLKWYRQLIALRQRWQAEGLLSPGSLTAHWDADGHFAQILYTHQDRSAFAVVRLHPAGEFPRRVQIATKGQVLLSQGCEPVRNLPGGLVLGDHAVAIGEGTVSVELEPRESETEGVST